MQSQECWLRSEELLGAGSLDAARQGYESLQADPVYGAAACLRLSLISGMRRDVRGSVEHALDAYRRRIPDADLLEMLAKRLLSIGERQAGLQVAKEMLEADGTQPRSLAEVGKLLVDFDETSLADVLLKLAEARGVSSAAMHYLIGLTEMHAGKMGEALSRFEDSIASDPMFARAHWAITKVSTSDERHSTALRRAIARASAGHPDVPILMYALFRRLDASGDRVAAWEALSSAMEGRRRQVPYHRGAAEAVFAGLHSLTLEPAIDQVNEGASPIFIVGLPRSGTTLLEQMLGHHADVANAGELRDLVLQLRYSANRPGPPMLDAELVDAARTADMIELGARYRQHAAWRASGSTFFTDKMPMNFMNIAFIIASLPDARIIHMVRNTMDVCFSNLKEMFAGPYAYSYDQHDMAHHYAMYDHLMRHWHRQYPGRILDVSYEKLVREPARTIESVRVHCGLSKQAGMEAIERRTNSVASASSVQVRRGLNASGIDAWDAYSDRLTALQDDLARFGIMV